MTSLKVAVLVSGDQVIADFEYDVCGTFYIAINPIMLKPVREGDTIMLIPYLLPTTDNHILLNKEKILIGPMEPNEHLIQMYKNLTIKPEEIKTNE